MGHFAMKAASSECTVVMATYNGAKYLTEQLVSLAQQTAPPARLIVSDDGSSDDTKEILAGYAKKAAFDVMIVDGPRQGYAENFWSAARLADTRYVAWADQDDVWHPQKILKCVQALKGYEADFVSHSATVVDSQLRPLGRFLPDYQVTRVLRATEGSPFNIAPGLACVFKRELLSEVAWADRPLSHMHMRQIGHDQAVELIAYAFHPRVQLSERLAYYRQHASNTQGDPSVVGLARQVSTALKVSADDYARFSSRAQGYADYISKISNSDDPAVRSFQAAAERARYRAEIRNGKNLYVRLRSLIGSTREGTYRSLDNGGFGTPALVNDSLASVISRMHRAG
jgi:glycosyltransferase involved in cell wall biosynthesis